MKVSYTEEAVADIVQAITYLDERNPTAQNGRVCTRCSQGSGVGESYADSFGHSDYWQPEIELGHRRRTTVADRHVILERAVQ